MFKGLQSRLTLSYVLVIFVCLVLVGLAAWVLLRGYQQALVVRRLLDRSVISARLTGEYLRRGLTPQEAVRRLTQQVNPSDEPRLLAYILDSSGHVIVGSNNRLDGQYFEELALNAGVDAPWPRQGEWQLAPGGRLLYVAQPVLPLLGGTPQEASYVLLLAELYPRLPVAQAALGGLLPRVVGAGLVAVALSVVVAALMAYSVARPLERIARAAEEIAAGNYEQQLDISAPSEVARLATSFNSMARQVQVTLQSQQDLVANVSHDLKTPLTSVQGFSQALLDGTALDESARHRAASIIHEEAGRMRRLVDDLLDLARLEGGQVSMAHEPVDVGNVLRTCADRFAPQSEQSGVSLSVEVPPTLPPVTGDADRLGQVFGNLVDNALKHAGKSSGGGRVALRAEQQDGLVVCSVTDNGPGIPATDLNRIFERFYQVDKSRARRRAGSGLGLAICQEIVRAHGGRIQAESVEGLGTRFTVELPLQSGQK
jgi:two-component system OmpR family sensor kinase